MVIYHTVVDVHHGMNASMRHGQEYGYSGSMIVMTVPIVYQLKEINMNEIFIIDTPYRKAMVTAQQIRDTYERARTIYGNSGLYGRAAIARVSNTMGISMSLAAHYTRLNTNGLDSIRAHQLP